VRLQIRYSFQLYKFWGSEGLFSHFWPLKVYFFLLHVKFPIDECLTRPYWLWAPNSAFGLLRLIFAFLTPKSIFFLTPCKIPDRWMYHTTILIVGSKFRFYALKAYFRLFDPQKYIFSYSMWTSRSMDALHDHTDYGVQPPFLGSEGLLSPLWPPKV
jgi:hypothetical protein